MSYVDNYTISGTFSGSDLVFTNRNGFTFSIELGSIGGVTGATGATSFTAFSYFEIYEIFTAG